MKAGDYITHIDGQLLYGLNLDEAVDKMRGNPGSSTTLTVVRPGRDKPFDLKITRARIELRPVKWEVKDGIGIVNINTFAEIPAPPPNGPDRDRQGHRRQALGLCRRLAVQPAAF